MCNTFIIILENYLDILIRYSRVIKQLYALCDCIMVNVPRRQFLSGGLNAFLIENDICTKRSTM